MPQKSISVDEGVSSESREGSLFGDLKPMIGPSSSHTAGPAKLAKYVNEALGGKPSQAKVTLCNSLARVWFGHGTKGAIIAGLLGHDPSSPVVSWADDDYARNQGLAVSWFYKIDSKLEPNTLEIEATGQGKKVYLKGVSTGGGAVAILSLKVMEN